MEDKEKGWVWIREQAKAVAFYRVRFGEKREKVLSVPYNEVMERQREIRKHFTSSSNSTKLLKYFSSFESRNREKLVQKKTFLTAQQIEEAMLAIEESLAERVKADPKCLKPENRLLGQRIWKHWTPIRQQIGNATGWNIKEAESKKVLGWGNPGSKDGDTNE